jgi:hypothetical protein
MIAGRSPWGESPRGALRLAVAASSAMAFVGLAVAMIEHRAADVVRQTVPLAPMARSPGFVVGLSVAGLALVAAFAHGRWATVAGLGAYGLLAWMNGLLGALGGGGAERFHVPAAVLLAWCVGLLLGRLANRGADVAFREAVADAAAAGALFAPYFVSGVSKFAHGGVDWGRGDALRTFLLASARFEPGTLRAAALDYLVDSPSLADALAKGVLFAQLAALVAPLFAPARAVTGLLLAGFHAGLWLLTRRAYPEALVLLLALSVPWPRLVPRLRSPSPGADEPPGVSWRAVGAGLAAAFVAAGLVARGPEATSQYSAGRPPRRDAAAQKAPVTVDEGTWTIRTSFDTEEGTSCREFAAGETRLWLLFPATPDMPMERCGPASLGPRDGDLAGKPFRYRADDAAAARLGEVLPLLPVESDQPSEGEAPEPPQ